MKRLQLIATLVVVLLLVIFAGAIVYRLAYPHSLAASPKAITNTVALPTQTPAIDCSPQATSAYVASLDSLMQRWDDAYILANSTARIALSPVVASLQSLRQEAVGLNSPPACVAFLHESQLAFMDYGIKSLLLFMQVGNNSYVDREASSYTKARALYDGYLQDFRGDPQRAYASLHESQALIGAFTDGSTWKTLRFAEGKPLVFSVPPDWTNPPSDDAQKVLIKNPTSDIELTFHIGDLTQPVAGASPSLAAITIQNDFLADDAQSVISAKFGENAGPLFRMAVAGGGFSRMSGAITTPEGDTLIFDAKKSLKPMTTEEERQIYTILASLRQWH